MISFEVLHQKVFHLLETELPSFLTYHSPLHTQYVIEQAEVISNIEKAGPQDIFIIKAAALFHDIGFIRQYKNHEEAGCEIAREILQGYSFDQRDIDTICGMIMATKIPQTPLTLNEKIIADADLEYLGTDQFYPISNLLFQELHYIDPEIDQIAFRDIQIRFLSNHTYHTDFCITNREPQKQRHLDELMERV